MTPSQWILTIAFVGFTYYLNTTSTKFYFYLILYLWKTKIIQTISSNQLIHLENPDFQEILQLSQLSLSKIHTLSLYRHAAVLLLLSLKASKITAYSLSHLLHFQTHFHTNPPNWIKTSHYFVNLHFPDEKQPI